MANFSEAVEITLAHESGAFVHDTTTGEVSRWGWTLTTYRDLVDPDATADTIYALTKEAATNLYEIHFWNFLDLNPVNDQTLAAKVFDIGVNQGREMSAMKLQDAVNDLQLGGVLIAVDGKIGPKTIAGVNELPAGHLLAAFRDRVEARYREIAQKNAYFAKKNAQGHSILDEWLARLES